MEDILEFQKYDIATRCNGQVVKTTSSTRRSYPATKIGVQNPFWRDQVKLGRNASTPYQRSGTRLILYKPYLVKRNLTKSCANVGSSTFVTREWSGCPVALPSLTVLMSDTEAMNKAIMQFVSAHEQQATSLLGGVYLKEWRQVQNMIRNPAKRLWTEVERYHRACQKGIRGSKARDHSSILSDLWLEYSFGWVPLIMDTKTAAEAAAKILERDYGVTVIRGYGRQESSTEKFSTFQPSGASACGKIRVVQANSNIVVIKGGLIPQVNGPTMTAHTLSQLGFTPNSFIPTVWEVIPYSFLVDYFVNVGDILHATFHSWGDLAWTSMARVGYQHYVASVLPVTPKEADYDWSVSPGKLMLTSQMFLRTVPSSSDFVPKLAFQVPGLTTQWLNLVALAKLKSVNTL